MVELLEAQEARRNDSSLGNRNLEPPTPRAEIEEKAAPTAPALEASPVNKKVVSQPATKISPAPVRSTTLDSGTDGRCRAGPSFSTTMEPDRPRVIITY